MLSTGFIPDPFAGETLRITSLVAGILMALVLLMSKVRGRAERVKHGMESEPAVLFMAKNLVFAGMIAAFSYMLASYKGLPNVLIVMLLLMLVLQNRQSLLGLCQI